MAADPKKKKRRLKGKKEIERELKEYKTFPLDFCQIDLKNDNEMIWIVTIQGPKDSCYNGIFELELGFSKRYPIEVPLHKMLTHTFHININEQGKICCGILDNEWKKESTVRDILLSVYDLLKKPDPTAAINDEALNLFVDNEKEYYKTAAQWTEKYASANKNSQQDSNTDDQKAGD